jgi:hypothetical protein
MRQVARVADPLQGPQSPPKTRTGLFVCLELRKDQERLGVGDGPGLEAGHDF